jgi:hypothetical protein
MEDVEAEGKVAAEEDSQGEGAKGRIYRLYIN